MPGYQSSTIAGTSWRQASISVALPPITTTTVFGFASTVERMSASPSLDRRSVRRSPPGANPLLSTASSRDGAVVGRSGGTSRAIASRSASVIGGKWCSISPAVPAASMYSPSSA